MLFCENDQELWYDSNFVNQIPETLWLCLTGGPLLPASQDIWASVFPSFSPIFPPEIE